VQQYGSTSSQQQLKRLGYCPTHATFTHGRAAFLVGEAVNSTTRSIQADLRLSAVFVQVQIQVDVPEQGIG